MYLVHLKDNEKEMFLKLAYSLSYADGSFSEEEGGMISAYCVEMGIANQKPVVMKNLEEVKVGFENSTVQAKKIVIFELIGLALADNKYEEKEQEFIRNLVVAFGLESDYVDTCKNVIIEYLVIQTKMNALVAG